MLSRLFSLWLVCGVASAASYTVPNPCPGSKIHFAYSANGDLLVQCQLGGAGLPTPKGVPTPAYVTRIRVVDATCQRAWMIYANQIVVCKQPPPITHN